MDQRLKLQGVNEFLSDLAFYTEEREYPEEFGARIFKITRDENGNRLTHLKVTGGIKGKTVITESDERSIRSVSIREKSMRQ